MYVNMFVTSKLGSLTVNATYNTRSALNRCHIGSASVRNSFAITVHLDDILR